MVSVFEGQLVAVAGWGYFGRLLLVYKKTWNFPAKSDFLGGKEDAIRLWT